MICSKITIRHFFDNLKLFFNRDCSPPIETLEKPEHIKIEELMIEQGFDPSVIKSMPATSRKFVVDDFKRILEKKESKKDEEAVTSKTIPERLGIGLQ